MMNTTKPSVVGPVSSDPLIMSSDNEEEPTPSSPVAEEEGDDQEELPEEDQEDEQDEEMNDDESAPAADAEDEDEEQGEDENDNQSENNENEAENDEDENDENEGEDDDEGEEQVMVGGSIDIEAFALVTGVFMNDASDASDRQVLSIPITRLPATLGRSHDSKDKNFFGLGTKKVLSRQQAVIYYRDRTGGRLNQNSGSQKLAYHAPKETAAKVIHKEDTTLPITGFFAVECLGKNRIFVDGQRLEQGEVALLESGSTLKMNAYNLVFLLPEDAKETTMKIPTASSSSSSGTKPKKKSSGKAAAVVEQLESTPVSTLLENFFDAIQSGQWERRHQMMGGAITLHACRDAARSKAVQKIANNNNGVSRSEVMDWIAASKRYGKWAVQVLNKMEVKSYQANVTKCLWKAGYRRNAPVGRFVRWNLPTEEELGPGEPMSEEEEEDDEEDDDEAEQDQAKTEEKDDNEDDEEDDDDEEDEDGVDEDNEETKDATNDDDDDDAEEGDQVEDEEEGGEDAEATGDGMDLSEDAAGADDDGDSGSGSDQDETNDESGGKRPRSDDDEVAAKKLRTNDDAAEDEEENDSD